MKIYALANELNIDRKNAGQIVVPFGTWDYGEKQLEDGRTVFFRQTLNQEGAAAIVLQIDESVYKGEKGVPVYWGHPDVPELAHKYPDKRAKGWIKYAKVYADGLHLAVEWLEENATEGFGWFSPYWTGPVEETGDGQALMAVNALASVALVNMPNIQEFRLANELQDANRHKGHYHMNQKLIEELAAKRDGVVVLNNEANYDESKHPRAKDGKFTDGAGGGSSGVEKDKKMTKREKGEEGFKRRMNDIGEVGELNELHRKFIESSSKDENPFEHSPETQKHFDAFQKKLSDLTKRGIVEHVRGAKLGEAYQYKPDLDKRRSSPKVNMGDGRSSWTDEERKRFADPTSHMKWTSLVNELAAKRK